MKVRNQVTIWAPIHKVQQFIFPAGYEEGYQRWKFNMHMLFPECFGIDNYWGDVESGSDWYLDFTGTFDPPVFEILKTTKRTTVFGYFTDWEPNNLTLQKMSELGQWTIQNAYIDDEWDGEYKCYYKVKNGLVMKRKIEPLPFLVEQESQQSESAENVAQGEYSKFEDIPF